MRKTLVAVGAFVVASLGLVVPAFAQTADPTPADSVTTLTSSAVSQMTPIIIAVATGLLALAVLSFGVKKVYRAIRSGGANV